MLTVRPESPVLIPECPLCCGTNRYYGFLMGQERFDECRDCGLLSHKSLEGPGTEGAAPYGADGPEEAAGLLEDFFGLLGGYGCCGGRVGVAGRVSHAFFDHAGRRGYAAKVIDRDDRLKAKFDVVVVADLLEDTAKPVAFLESLRDYLVPAGVLAVLTRQLRNMGDRNPGRRLLRGRQRHSFSDHNLLTLLWKAGFSDACLDHQVAPEDGALKSGWVQDQAIAFGRMRDLRPFPVLSVVVPVFNEARTVRQVLGSLAAKKIPGVDMEVIVVESRSADGSREIVREFEGRPPFNVVLEDRPRGKGFAVRTGLRHATGDVVLIQDADLEYDFLDYEMLLSPVLAGRSAFVLGTRHAGNWKIRKFDQYFLAEAMDLAHWSLVYLMNRLYGQSMTDPFTMFKVFRRDCLFGLDFECNRFDFDVELVCKLIRKGFSPLEIPVNYQARSFREGKKVNVFRDPFTWIKAMIKYRIVDVVRPPSGPAVAAGPANGTAS